MIEPEMTDWKYLALVAMLLAVMLWVSLEILKCRMLIAGAVDRGDRRLAELEWRLSADVDVDREAVH